MRYHIVIPARYGSTRLPGKPLVDIGGAPMIVRVAERALQTDAQTITVATDDERVLQAVNDADLDRVEAVMTSPDHASGSDRVMEVVRARGWSDDAVVVNVQGDEPLIPPVVIDQVAAMLTSSDISWLAHQDPACDVATLAEPITSGADVFDANIVKVVTDDKKRALYFSRAPIPWSRDLFANGPPSTLPKHGWWRHIGIYAYRVRALARFVELSLGDLEHTESLEQLRLLRDGIGITVTEALAQVPGGVDTPEDAQRVAERYAAETD